MKTKKLWYLVTWDGVVIDEKKRQPAKWYKGRYFRSMEEAKVGYIKMHTDAIERAKEELQEAQRGLIRAKRILNFPKYKT